MRKGEKIKKFLILGFPTLIRVLNFLIWRFNSLLRCLGNFLIKHLDNCGFASRPKCGLDHILDTFPANSRGTRNIIPETTSSRTACCANCEHNREHFAGRLFGLKPLRPVRWYLQ